MPTLDWIGKKAVLNHHRQVPYRLLRGDPILSAGDPESGNLLVQGDNLLALKALLPYYAGKVKCIYIDPPYNTGNEKWVYNDAVNSPEMQRWLGKVVGAEAEDLSRHDKWLCMMYPRLSLLKDFLTGDGVIFVSIDDNELQNACTLLDEIFGLRCRLAILVWKSRHFTDTRPLNGISSDHEYILVYGRNPDARLRGKTKDLGKYANPDNDPRGPWTSCSLLGKATKEQRPNLHYDFHDPLVGSVFPCPERTGWICARETMGSYARDRRLLYPKKESGRLRVKVFLSELRSQFMGFPSVITEYSTSDGTMELREILQRQVFSFPKPSALVAALIEQATTTESIVMDSFAGSGTTGHAVLAVNRQDGGNRRFILVEMDESICRTITAQRLTRAVNGYASRAVASISDRREENRRSETAATEAASISEGRNEDKRVEGLGGGFRYCGLGEPLFDESGKICGTVRFSDLAAHVFFTETGTPIPKRATGKSPLLGEHNGKAIYLLFNGIMGDKTAKGGNVLTHEILKALSEPARRSETAATTKVIYGEGCRLGDMRLKREGIVFKQVPYAIKVS